VQSVRICRAATETHVFRCVLFLERLFLFHFVGRFCETPSERGVNAKASDTDALQFFLWRAGIRTQLWPDVE
jgi:hypothetical protein